MVVTPKYCVNSLDDEFERLFKSEVYSNNNDNKLNGDIFKEDKFLEQLYLISKLHLDLEKKYNILNDYAKVITKSKK